MNRHFQLALPGSRPQLDGVDVAAPARFYQRQIVGGRVSGLWIGGQRMYGVTIHDPADRPVGTIGPDSPHAAEAYDSLQRVLVCEALQADPVPVAVEAVFVLS
jgi:hypothetical protein